MTDAVRVTGVVFGHGPAGEKLPGAELWTMSFRLFPWRREGGDIELIELHVSMTIEEDISAYRDRIRAGEVLAIDATEPGPHHNGLQTTMTALLGPVDAPDLIAAGEAWLAERRIDAPEFEHFVFDPALKWYEGEIDWLGTPVRLSLSAEPITVRVDDAVAAARQLLADAPEIDRRLRECMVAKMLPIRNDFWIDEDAGDVEMTAEPFLAAIRLTSIGVADDGGVAFYHDDGDLFWGHSIVVSIDAETGELDANLAG